MRIQTVQQLISVWKDIATRHYQINGFGIGDDWEVGASEAKMHPVLWINPVSATMPESEFAGYKTFEIDFEIKVFDLVNKDETNENEVLSDTIDILKDCITELKGHPYYTNSQLDIVDDITFEPFTEEFDEEVSGWSAEITFKSPVLRSWCGLPMEDITGFEFPGNDCPDVNVLCPVFVQDVIGTYPIIVTNGNDSTKIVSIDQDALVDTYVTGQTFSGNNLQTTLNNGDIINTDINDFDSLNVNGTIIATTYNGDGSNLTGIDSTNIYNTSNSLTDNRIVDLDSNTLSFDGDGGNIAIYNPDGLATLTSDNSNIFNARSRDGIKGIELYDNISVIGTNGLRITDDLGAINNFQSFKSTPDRLISRKFTGGKDHYYFRYTPLNSRFLVFPDGILGDGVNIGGDTSLGCANISLHDDTTIGGKLTFGIDTTETSDGCLIDDSLSFHINGTDELAGRYKNNLGVVTDLKFPTESGLMSVNDSNGVPTYYTVLQTAVTAAGDNGVVHLHSNINILTATEQVTLINGYTLTINGNGYRITHTSNIGDRFKLFTGGGATGKLYLNNLKILSNGTLGGTYTATIFGRVGLVQCSKDTYIEAINNDIKEFGEIRGGTLVAQNRFVGFSCSVYDAKVTTKFGRGNFTNCHITINTGGLIGQLSKISNCKIYGDAISGELIKTKNIENTDVYCSSGANPAVEIANGGVTEEYQVRNCNIYHYGTGRGIAGTYGRARDCYVYSEGGNAVYFQNTPTVGGYHALNIICETNGTNTNAFHRLNNGPEFRMKNVTAVNLNTANTQPAINIRVTGAHILTMEDCTATVNNASADNVELKSTPSTGGAYIYNLRMSKIGQGLNLGSVPLLNINTLDSYGNGQVG